MVNSVSQRQSEFRSSIRTGLARSVSPPRCAARHFAHRLSPAEKAASRLASAPRRRRLAAPSVASAARLAASVVAWLASAVAWVASAAASVESAAPSAGSAAASAAFRAEAVEWAGPSAASPAAAAPAGQRHQHRRRDRPRQQCRQLKPTFHRQQFLLRRHRLQRRRIAFGEHHPRRRPRVRIAIRRSPPVASSPRATSWSPRPARAASRPRTRRRTSRRNR